MSLEDSERIDVLELFKSKKYLNISAPMVRYSKLPFRKLVRKYNCDLCFTPMMMADSFVASELARWNEFVTDATDRPLIAQFAAKTTDDFVTAAQLVYPFCDGVDLNCGCPQRWAMQDGYGAKMLRSPELICDLVRQLRASLPQPFSVSVKIRLQSDRKQSVELCRRLQHCGVSFVSVHGRTAAERRQPADYDSIGLVTSACPGLPIVANGDVDSVQGTASDEEDEDQQHEGEEDAWDDSVLIDAYDKAMGFAMKEVERRLHQGQMSNGATENALDQKANKKSSKKKSGSVKPKKETMWKVGMPCQAVYTEDGEFYEAIIESLSLEDETCVIKFLGYNNKQSMSINDLFITQGTEFAEQQIKAAELTKEAERQAAAMDWQSHVFKSSTSKAKKEVKKSQPSSVPSQITALDPNFAMSIPPPPPISQFLPHLPTDEAEALSSMCMSWYLNGFHTGYYLGLKQGQKPQ